MKKILILIATVSLLFACDKTENEQDIMDAFFGDGAEDTRLRPEVYGQMQPSTNVYLQEFTSAATSDWAEKNDEYSLTGYANGELVIQGKQSHYTWKGIPNLNQNVDFQIELRVLFNFTAITSAEPFMGVIWGVDDNATTMNYLALISNDKNTVEIGNYVSKNNTVLYNKPSGLAKNVHHTYTLRKVENMMYLFEDKSFVYKINFKPFTSNYGFMVYKNGIISVDYVRVDYIEAGSK